MITKIRPLDGFSGDAALYRLDDGSYVIASSTSTYCPPETLVFPSNQNGEVTSWNEIGGGRGYLDHETALATL